MKFYSHNTDKKVAKSISFKERKASKYQPGGEDSIYRQVDINIPFKKGGKLVICFLPKNEVHASLTVLVNKNMTAVAESSNSLPAVSSSPGPNLQNYIT